MRRSLLSPSRAAISALIVGLLVLGSLAGSHLSAQATVGGAQGPIFYRDRSDGAIYRMRPNGADKQLIVPASRPAGPGIAGFRFADSPALSPDGTRLMFSAEQLVGSINGNEIWRRTLYSGAADGSDIRPMLDYEGAEGEWSPTVPRRVAFTAQNQQGGRDLWIVDLNSQWRAPGDSEVKLTAVGDQVVSDPDWSPDGRGIAFDQLKMNPNGPVLPPYPTMSLNIVQPVFDGQVTTVFGNVGTSQLYYPSWSPDSTKLLFADSFGINTIGINGAGQSIPNTFTRLFGTGTASQALWAPSNDRASTGDTFLVLFGSNMHIVHTSGARADGSAQADRGPKLASGVNPFWAPVTLQVLIARPPAPPAPDHVIARANEIQDRSCTRLENLLKQPCLIRPPQ